MKRALLLVDLQNDFFPGGKLAVKNGDKILPAIQKLLKQPFDLIVATKDWHPPNHFSFASTHKRQPGESIEVEGYRQHLWPVHCVQESKGAEFAPGWDTTKPSRIFYKGVDPHIDSYSAFFDNLHKRSTGLSEYLLEHKVAEIYIAGLATDYCVKFTALDALSLGFTVYVVKEGCAAVNLALGDESLALQEMEKAGARLISCESSTLF